LMIRNASRRSKPKLRRRFLNDLSTSSMNRRFCVCVGQLVRTHNTPPMRVRRSY
jgi:hypothetical protein